MATRSRSSQPVADARKASRASRGTASSRARGAGRALAARSDELIEAGVRAATAWTDAYAELWSGLARSGVTLGASLARTATHGVLEMPGVLLAEPADRTRATALAREAGEAASQYFTEAAALVRKSVERFRQSLERR